MRAPPVTTILIIDDDRAFVADLLRLWHPGTSLRTAASSREALATLAREAPDLILLDLSMPHDLAPIDDEEGLALLRHLRRELGCRVPVIVLTGRREPGIRNRALALGASAVVEKPVGVETLEAAIAEAYANLGEQGGEEAPRINSQRAQADHDGVPDNQGRVHPKSRRDVS